MLDIKRIVSKLLKKALQPPAITNCKIDKRAHICSASAINNTIVGKYTYIGDGCFSVNCLIGSFCSIAYNCQIGGAMHPISRVSSSPVFHDGANSLHKHFARFPKIETKQTIIGSDVWIGVNSVIKSGVKIGHGAVIGAGSIVTKDIPAYEIWAGNPAHKIKDRFPDEIKSKLLQLQWWEWNDDKIERFADYFNNPADLLNAIESEN